MRKGCIVVAEAIAVHILWTGRKIPMTSEEIALIGGVSGARDLRYLRRYYELIADINAPRAYKYVMHQGYFFSKDFINFCKKIAG